MASVVPFEYIAHVLTISVTVGAVETKFIFDTGIGVSLIGEDLAAKVGCHPDGATFTGRRMRLTVGDRFLRNFTTTYDLARSRVIFAIPG